jgi:predicted small metal-binding protein
MKHFACGELVPGCETVFRAESEDDILEQVAVHARDDHGMDEVPAEVEDRIRSRILDTEA